MIESHTSKVAAGIRVMTKEQIVVALGSATRSEILAELIEGGPKSISAVADNLGASADGLYHHFMRLEEVGLIQLTGSRSLLRHKERVYEATAERFILPSSSKDKPTREALIEAAGSFFRGVVRIFARAYPTGPESRADAEIVEFSAKSSFLTQEELTKIQELNTEIDAILLAGKNRKTGHHYMVTRALFPCTRERKARPSTTAVVGMKEPG